MNSFYYCVYDRLFMLWENPLTPQKDLKWSYLITAGKGMASVKAKRFFRDVEGMKTKRVTNRAASVFQS